LKKLASALLCKLHYHARIAIGVADGRYRRLLLMIICVSAH